MAPGIRTSENYAKWIYLEVCANIRPDAVPAESSFCYLFLSFSLSISFCLQRDSYGDQSGFG